MIVIISFGSFVFLDDGYFVSFVLLYYMFLFFYFSIFSSSV